MSSGLGAVRLADCRLVRVGVTVVAMAACIMWDMRIARFTKDDKTPQYAFVQKDEQDGKDYLVVLSGYPFGAQPVEPTGERFPQIGRAHV